MGATLLSHSLMRIFRDAATTESDLNGLQQFTKHSVIERRVSQSHILEIRYEELVANAEATVRAVCEFLGERFEPEMLEFRSRLGMVPERGQTFASWLG